MSYKPDEGTWMAYLYGELEGTEKEKVERYLAEQPDARRELEKWQQIRSMMGFVKDKEVIAPPIVLDQGRDYFNWRSPFLRTVFAVAASLLLLMVAGRLTDFRMRVESRQIIISFGPSENGKTEDIPVIRNTPSLTGEDVQRMIDNSLKTNNEVMQTALDDTHRQLDASIRSSLAMNSSRFDKLVREASTGSQEQIRDYVASLQTQNAQLVKDYFQLAKKEQNQYIEDLLIDFAKYLQQQRSEDLMVMQARLNTIEQHTDLFKQETEQILSSIISNANTTKIKY